MTYLSCVCVAFAHYRTYKCTLGLAVVSKRSVAISQLHLISTNLPVAHCDIGPHCDMYKGEQLLAMLVLATLGYDRSI